MPKLLHPVTFRRKRTISLLNIIIMITILPIAVIGYFISRNLFSTNEPLKNIKLDGFKKMLTILETPAAYTTPGLSFDLPKAVWVPQTFNNCGPAATSMVLQYFGYKVSQEETKAHLRTNPDDKNVFITEISNYIRDDYNIDNKVFINGDLKTIKTLVTNGIYVVVEDFLHSNEDIGHVLIIHGFDDTEKVLIADDPYFGVGIKYPYEKWEETQWKPYGREFMPVYLSEKESLVKSIIGENWDEKTMHKNSVKRNLNDVENNPNDTFAWFNLGASYYALGDYKNAKEAFERSQAIGWPKRMLWYQIQPVQTYNKLGEYQKAIDTANLGLWYNDNFAEMHYEKAFAYKNLGDMTNLKIEIQKTLDSDPNFDDSYNLFN